MHKKLAGVISAFVILLAAAMPFGTASAQSSTNTQRTDVTGLIQSGLWEGINFVPLGSLQPSSANNRSSAPQPKTNPGAYFALGDSVAAGVGLTHASAEPANEQRCGRTSGAYAYSVAQTMGLNLNHRACSGATTRDLYTRDWTPSPSIAAQLDTAFANGTPELITLTSGANDIRWVNYLQVCYARDCATRTSSVAVTSLLKTLQGRLIRVFDEIERRSGGNPPTVVITGYYNPVSDACSAIEPRATPAEVQWISSGVDALNSTIRDIADNYSFVRYAAVDFSGHDICSNDSWIQGQGSPQPFHPTAEGQQAMARSILRSLGK